MNEGRPHFSAFESEPLERDLLELALEGIELPTGAGSQDMRSLVVGLTEHQPGIFFPFFWSSRDVDCLQADRLKGISLDDVIWYLRSLWGILQVRYPSGLHWMEMSNLYHVFGLLRLVAGHDEGNRNAAATAIRETFLPERTTQLHSIAEVSAFSALAVLEEREPQDMAKYLNWLISSPSCLGFYGTYQLYYYGSLDSCVDSLSRYRLENRNTVFLPQSILGLLAVRTRIRSVDPKEAGHKIKDELLDLLDTPTKRMTERFLPRTESF